jgi:hypothetical protein
VSELELLNLGASVGVPNAVLARQLTAGFWIATLVFGAVLALIVTERLHTAVVFAVSLVDGAIGDELFIIDFEQAILCRCLSPRFWLPT